MNIVLHKQPTTALTHWVPIYRPMNLFDEIDAMARDFWNSWRPGFINGTLLPNTDIYEEKDHLVIKTDLPGINKEELEVALDGDTLTIKAAKEEKAAEDATHHTRERYYGSYYRTMTLPFHVDGDNISATLTEGILELKLPRAEESKPKRIEVKAQLPRGKGKKTQRKPRQKKTE